jgi:ribose 5-phosphate isomerase B
VLCLGARVLGAGLALDLVDAFINAEFEGDRHTRRLSLIENIENGKKL